MDKPAGPTSHDVVARVRRALGTRVVGHTGTLDPFATGLLVILVGRVTRLARFIERHPKQYLAEAVFGVSTDTDDRDGEVIGRTAVETWPTREAMERELAGFRGVSLQRPPAYSARKVEGQRAYALARKGRQVDLPSREIEVLDTGVDDWTPPVLCFRVLVLAGTYVRALARDLGERLGTGAHLGALRRERIGPFRVDQALSLDEVSEGCALLTPRELLAGLAEVELAEQEAKAVRHGRPIQRAGAEGEAMMTRDGQVLAVGEGREGAWHPRVVLESA